MKNKVALSKLFPIMFGFFVMGFCDIVGVVTSFVKDDFNLSESVAGFLPSMVFLWFLLISIPVSIIMNRVGRKNMVLISLVVTLIGVIIPYVRYDFVICLVAFSFLGIGNTILQVALNPLLSNVVQGNNFVSALTSGQFIKAISSFCGPLIAIFAAKTLGMWSYLFPIYAVITLISLIWLLSVPIARETVATESTSFSAVFRLLKDKRILLLFGGIVFIVGTDVGMNTIAPKLLISHCGKTTADAGIASSVYFAFRTAGTFIGAILLKRLNSIKYFKLNICLALAFIAGLYFVREEMPILVLIALIGFACATVFSIIYSIALDIKPDKANEISGLMITGVCGGAIVPPLMGFFADLFQSQNGSLLVITICIVYLVFCAFSIKTSKAAGS